MNKKYKWLVVSALQKSIRRGLVELSMVYAKWLWEIDKSYLMYRLGIILTEDVGVGNRDLLYKLLSTELRKKEIEASGGYDFIMMIVKEAAQSVKNRSMCEITSIVKHMGANPTLIKGIVNAKDKTQFIYEKFNCKDLDYLEKVALIWLIMGNTRFKTESLPFFNKEEKESKELVVQNIDTVSKLFALNDEDKVVFRGGYVSQREPFILSYPVINELYNQGQSHTIDQSFSNELINVDSLRVPLLACAVDGHTREGAWAMNQFVKTKEISRYFSGIEYKKKTRIISHLVFYYEGGVTDRLLCNDDFITISYLVRERMIKAITGVNFNYQDAQSVIINNIEVLNKLREQSVNRSY